MIVLFTDFGLAGPYVGQMKAVLQQAAPGVPVIDLFADLPPFDARSAAYLLAAYGCGYPPGTVFLCVVDPGVGSQRRAALVRADGCWYVGPDNGLFNILARRAGQIEWWDILWRPQQLSASFHGRDLFAPVAAELVRGRVPEASAQAVADRVDTTWPDDLYQVVYIDHFGNAMTGVRAAMVAEGMQVQVGAHRIGRARTFAEVDVGRPFWYANANGLLELAVNRGRADALLHLAVGDAIQCG